MKVSAGNSSAGRCTQKILDGAVGDGEPILRALHGDAKAFLAAEIVQRHAPGLGDEALGRVAPQLSSAGVIIWVHKSVASARYGSLRLFQAGRGMEEQFHSANICRAAWRRRIVQAETQGAPRAGAAIQVRDLHVAYGSMRVLEGVSLDVAPGTFIALLGASGCGKTTLLRAFAVSCRPSSGTIRVGGRDITRLPPEKRGMAMVFQSYALWPHMTVLQNIGYGLKLRGAPQDEIAARWRAARDAGADAARGPQGHGSCRAGSASASRSGGRSPSTRASCCSTSRCPISTPRCA